MSAGPVVDGRTSDNSGASDRYVIFAHGNGSSPRNQCVSEVWNTAGLATLLFDLLTPEEERDRANVFDVELLERRLGKCHRLTSQPDAAALRGSATSVRASGQAPGWSPWRIPAVRVAAVV